MKNFPAIFLAFIANAYGVCEDDLVALEAGQLPAVWSVGNIPHVFINSARLRGVVSIRDYKITGLDTVRTSLHFCPSDMTIYGNLTARIIQGTGKHTDNFDFINRGSEVFAHGDGVMNMTFTNVQLRNLVAPIRYSRQTKRLQLDGMQYELQEEAVNSEITGLEMDGEDAHRMSTDELKKLDQSNSCPMVLEFLRAIVNSRVQKGILVAAVKQMFASAF